MQGPVTVAWKHRGLDQQKTRCRAQPLCSNVGRKKVEKLMEN